MNRVLYSGHLLPRFSISNAKLPFLSLFQSHSCTRTRMNSQLQKNQPEVSSTISTINKEISDLSTKKCAPCNIKGLQPMTEEAAHALIPQVSQWNLVKEGGTLKLARSWKAKTFAKGLEIFKTVADIAEAEGHHPDLHLVGWNNVTVEIWTHSAGGLTENDFILAAKINELNLHDLLRQKASG